MELHYQRGKWNALSREDRQFLKIVGDGICHRGDVHHEMPLPFEGKNVQLPNNRLQAVQPLHGLKKETPRWPEVLCWLHQLQDWNYRQGICPKGERWTTSSSKEGKVCHLAHHGSLSPAKTKQHPCSMWLLSWLLGWIDQWSPVTRARPYKQTNSSLCRLSVYRRDVPTLLWNARLKTMNSTIFIINLR